MGCRSPCGQPDKRGVENRDVPRDRDQPGDVLTGQSHEASIGTLEATLRSQSPAALAADARRLGDPRRGAAVFFQPSLTCTKCHVGENGAPALGPDLASLGKDVADVYLVESILDPSKAIKKGYETVTVSIDDGRTVAGLLGEDRPDAVVLRDPGQDGKPITIPKAQIEERKDGGTSIMPAGLVNNLGTRQQFLDLVRYLMEIAEKGPERARELKPDPSLLAAAPLPQSERDIDHAGLIAGLDEGSFERGKSIYERVCINCHGTKDRPGSLPTSLRFASGTFKNGSDPLSMYRTLTLGFGQMTAQGWMVPRQKYDVIHYIREAYLKTSNPGQYAPVDRTYLARLPEGKSRGPEPVEIQPWATMDYGPSLMATYEVGGGDPPNIAYKGIAIRLDPGPGGVSRGGPGWSTTRIPSGSRPHGRGRASSTGTGSTSTGSTRSIRGSQASWNSPTRTRRPGRTPRMGAGSTFASEAATAGPMGPCRDAWSTIAGSTAMATGSSSRTPSVRPRSWRPRGWRPTWRARMDRSSRER